MKILFVCTGNICRSPTAEGVLRHYAMRMQLNVLVASAGTQGYHVGEAPDSRSIATAKRRGVDISAQRAMRVSVKDFHEYDLILAMDTGHLQTLKRLQPSGSKAVLELFLPYAGIAGTLDVPDPYYSGQDAFDAVYELIDSGVKALLGRITPGPCVL